MNQKPVSRNSYTVAPEDDPRFRTGLIVFAGVAIANALYITFGTMSSVKGHPARSVLAACVIADALLMAGCAYLFKTQRRAKIAGAALVFLSVIPTLTAQAITRTGRTLHVGDALYVGAPFFLLVILRRTWFGIKSGRM